MNKREKEVIQLQLEAEEDVLHELEKQYKQALNQIDQKIRILMSDELTQSKIYQIEYQKALRGQIEGILEKLHGDEFSTIQEYLKNCYTEAYVGTMYSIHGQGIPVITPIDQAAAVKAVLTDSKISKGLYTALGVDVNGLKKSIRSEISRGIATSMPYADIARNIANVSNAPLKRANTIVRTEAHRIQQQSADDARSAAKGKGADVVKMWDAALDGRTRSTHRRLDGQIREIDEPFEMDGKEAMYPGGFGDPAEDCNCRCVALTRARWALDEDELETLKARAEYFGLDKTKDFDDFREKYLEASKMAAQSQDNDWSKTVARTVTEEERQQVVQYAKARGIEVGDIEGFDGDIELLKAEIDVVSRTSKEYGIKETITVNSRILKKDEDFAETLGHVITFNTKALRDRAITEYNIVSSGRFASRTLEDIALHEMMHIFSQENDLNGIAIGRKIYYNVEDEYISSGHLRKYLAKEVSLYSSENKDAEIISEVVLRNKNNPTPFTEKFVLFLKGELPNAGA